MSKDKMGNELESDGVFIVKRALIGSAWCCAPKHMTREQVQEAVNETCEPYIPAMNDEPPTPWTVTPREHTDPELQSPGHCNECPDTRQHWFMLGGISGAFMMALSSDSSGFPDDLPMQ